VLLFVVVFSLIIISVFVVSILQCFCNLCGSSQVKYSNCQRISTYIPNFLLLFTVVIAASMGIYFLLLSSRQAQDDLFLVKNEVSNFSSTVNEIIRNVNGLNELNVYNFSLPNEVNDLFGRVQSVNQFLQSDEIRTTFSFDWVIIVAFVFLIVLAIGASISSYFNMKVIYIILGYLLFFCFLILSVTAITTVSFGAFASNFCASGIDTNMVKIINSLELNGTCLETITKNIFFCGGNSSNSTCNPYADANAEILQGIEFINETIHQNNTDSNATLALDFLLSLQQNIVTISDCRGTQSFYNDFSNQLCFGTIATLVNLSTSLELISLIIFLFLLTALYTWHRITPTGKVSQVYDYQSISGQPNTRNELSPTQDPDMDVSLGCFLHVSLIVLFWGLFTFGAFIMLSYGAQEVQVPRIGE